MVIKIEQALKPYLLIKKEKERLSKPQDKLIMSWTKQLR